MTWNEITGSVSTKRVWRTTNISLARVHHFRSVPVLDGSLDGWLKALDMLAQLPVRQAVPGHGDLVRKWPAGLADERRYFECLQRQIRAMIARGVPLATAADTACIDERSRWQLFDEYHARDATAAYAEIEWE